MTPEAKVLGQIANISELCHKILRVCDSVLVRIQVAIGEDFAA